MKAPGGTPASRKHWLNSHPLHGVADAALKTTQLPAISAAAAGPPASANGKLNGVLKHHKADANTEIDSLFGVDAKGEPVATKVFTLVFENKRLVSRKEARITAGKAVPNKAQQIIYNGFGEKALHLFYTESSSLELDASISYSYSEAGFLEKVVLKNESDGLVEQVWNYQYDVLMQPLAKISAGRFEHAGWAQRLSQYRWNDNGPEGRRTAYTRFMNPLRVSGF